MNKSITTYPLVSLAVLSYEKTEWIAEGIESALNQDYPNSEIIVIDNCSVGDNVKIANEYPVTVIRQEKNTGCVGIVNRAVQESKGEFVMIFSAEDPLMPGIISKQMNKFKDNPELDFVGSWYSLIKEDGSHMRTFESKWDTEAIKSYCCMSGCFLARRSFWSKVKFRDVVVNDIHAYQDWDMWFQVKALGLKGDVIKEVGFKYRQHDGATQEAIKIHSHFMKKLAEMNKGAYC